MNTRSKIKSKCKKLEDLLLQKNAKYGLSTTAAECFLRSRCRRWHQGAHRRQAQAIKNAGLVDATEDTLQDLAGYLILLMIAKDNATIFKNVYDKTNPHYIPLPQALARIQTGRSSTLVTEVRDGDKEKKKELPVVCFSGEFASRSDDALFEHSGFTILDFDHVDVDQTKRALPRMISFIHAGLRRVETESRHWSTSRTPSDTAITSEPSSSTSKEHMDLN